MPREQAAVQGNLTRVLPDASRQEVARQARQVFGNFACFFADLLGLNRRALALQRAYVTKVQGLPHLQAVLQTHRGFVAATAHLGNWELAGRLLSTYGRRIHVLMAPEQDPAIQRFLREGMQEADVCFVTNDSSAVFVQLLMALRRGDVVAVQMDLQLAIAVTSLCHSLALRRCFRLAPFSWPGQPKSQCYHVFV